MTDVTTHERLARLEAEIAALRQSADARRPLWRPRLGSTRRRTVASLLLVLLLTLSATAGVYAIDRFSDVPTAHFAHDDINAIADAGITAGCGGTNYCPESAVTRGQMAAFLHRSLGRAGRTHVQTATLGSTANVAVASVSVTVPGAAGSTVPTNGFVLVHAVGTPDVTSVSGCPCSVRMRVSDPAGGSSFYMAENLASSGYYGNLSNTYLFAVSAVPGTIRQFNVDAFFRTDNFGSVNAVLWVDATALWVPFGSTGTSAP